MGWWYFEVVSTVVYPLRFSAKKMQDDNMISQYFCELFLSDFILGDKKMGYLSSQAMIV